MPSLMTVTLNCPACPEAVTVPISIATRPGSGQQGQRGITIGISADISDEGRQIIAEHARVAHSDGVDNHTA